VDDSSAVEEARSTPWGADGRVSVEMAARLIAAQFPELGSRRIERIGGGWDNEAYLVDGRIVFRFPRREVGALCMRNEIASLPQLEGKLPLPIPRITHVGAPGLGYLWPFAGYAKLPGRTACSVRWTDEERGDCAEPLGRFLAALHGLPVPEDAPPDPAGAKDVAALVAKSRGWLDKLEALVDREEGSSGLRASIAEIREALVPLARTPEWLGERRWVHGDLYARHVLVDEAKRPCGVIDWGDVHAGERADDLAIAYSLLPSAARARFFEAYGDADTATRDRARLYAIHSGVVVSVYGRNVGDRDLVAMGKAALEFAVA
jgi:aminoglycoside phosphotransferase (APT) family kinase protein